jgi:L-aspartate oxidase
MAADVLVIGSGLAGLAAALEAAEAGASVVIAAGAPGSSERAQGGIAAAVGAGDSPELHAADTVAAGAGHCDVEAVRLLTSEAPGAVDWLTARGVAFDRGPDGSFDLALEAAHGRRRIVHGGGDASGAAIVAPLLARLAALPDGRVTRLDGARLVALLAGSSGLAGACLRWQGAELEVRAAATVLATGGYAGLYERSTTSDACDGSALVAALAAGATLADLEFVQFHPTAFAGDGPSFLLTEALRGAGAHVLDAGGRRFLLDVDPRGELAPRAVVARAVVEHLRATGSPHVLLDARHLGAERLGREFPGFLARCRQVGLDPLVQPVPVAPAAHYTMGGVVTDLWSRTGVPGLLAAGECARTGVHGANRLASNSLLEAVVFGRRAGRAALDERAVLASGAAPPAAAAGSLGFDDVRRALGRGAGPLRSEPELTAARDELAAGRGATDRAEAARALACLVLGAALERRESRGAHVRTDHPVEDESWSGRLLTWQRGEPWEIASSCRRTSSTSRSPAPASPSPAGI